MSVGLLLLGAVLVIEGRSLPSPCPGLFQYHVENSQWTGRVTVLVPDRAKSVTVDVSLYIADVLPPEFPGGLYLTKTKDVITKDILYNGKKTIDYLLTFPIQRPLPMIDRIQVNNQLVCEGPRVKGGILMKTSFSNSLDFTRLSHAEKESELSELRLGLQKEILNKSRELGKKYNHLPKDERKMLGKNHKQLNPDVEISLSTSHKDETNLPKSVKNLEKNPEDLFKISLQDRRPNSEIEDLLSSNHRGDKVDKPPIHELNPINDVESIIIENVTFQTNIPQAHNSGGTFPFGKPETKPEFNPKDDVEMLNGKPLPEINVLYPKSPGKTSDHGEPSISNKDLFNPKDDAEIFDENLLKKIIVPKITTVPFNSKDGKSDVSKGDFNPKNDVEIFDKKLLQKKQPKLLVPPQNTNYGSSGVSKPEFNLNDEVEWVNIDKDKENVFAVKHFIPKKKYNPKDDAEMFETGLFLEKGFKMNPKSSKIKDDRLNVDPTLNISYIQYKKTLKGNERSKN